MLKTITFAVLHFSVAFSVSYLLTGSIGISGAVAVIEPLANTLVFYFHEKAWKHCEDRKNGTPLRYGKIQAKPENVLI